MIKKSSTKGSDDHSKGLIRVKTTLTSFIQQGVVDKRVTDLLLTDEGFIAIEGELLDYKREVASDASALAKCVLQIVSLHNSFGGYLLLGVDETVKDQKFIPYGMKAGCVSQQQLRNLVRNYTGRTIDAVFTEISVLFQGAEVNVGLIYVPKRLPHLAPVQFGKLGPKKDEKPLFSIGDVFYRVQDTNARAQSSEDWWFLASDRPSPDASLEPLAVPLVGTRKKIVDENLPDRNLICPKFVGRAEMILELWRWLSDDFQYAKVLAGDGGKGKTSIAYEFAEEVCRSRPFDFEKVIWLTAKTTQFRGLGDVYDPVAAHYGSFLELLRALCEQLAILPAEVEGSSPNLLKQILRGALAEIHTFIVVDDVDSLSPDEQRMVLELAFQIGTSRSRFLLTTRKNFTYSADLSLTVQGFGKADYVEYVLDLQERLGEPRLPTSSIEKLRKATDGSPLYTESLVRLLRNKMDLQTAIARWKGPLGMKVRKAALEREIENLSLEGRRVLLAAVYLLECSYTELRQVTGYDDEDLLARIDELKALFLIGAPSIISKEARFTVQTNTRTLVLAYERDIVTDPTSIRHKCEKIRSGSESIAKRGNRKEIAAAITQANAFLREEAWEDAFSTLNVTINRHKDNPDLLFALAKCHLAKRLPDHITAKKKLKAAYNAGQRKYQLYATWYDCEIKSKHPAGAVEVADLAIKHDVADRVEWFLKRAAAYKASSLIRERGNDIDGAIEELRSCNTDLKVARPLSRNNQAEEILASLDVVGQHLWQLCRKRADDIPGWVKAFDVLREVISSASHSVTIASNMVYCVEQIVRIAKVKGNLTESQKNLVNQLLRQSIGYVTTNRPDKDGVAFAPVELRISEVGSLISSLSSTSTASILPNSNTDQFDVFLAHNSRDKPAIRVISASLEARGIATWLDEKDIPPGQLFQDYIQKALPTAKAIAVVIGPNGLGRWQAFELRAAISKAVEKGVPVIPVFLPDSKDVSAELPFLTEFNYVRFRTLDDAAALEMLIWGIHYGTRPKAP